MKILIKRDMNGETQQLKYKMEVEDNVNMSTAVLPTQVTQDDVINVFYHALLENDMAVVQDVVKNQNVNVNLILKDESYIQPWHRGCGAIHIVTRRAIVDSLKFLVELGGRVNLENKHGDTPLHIASKYGLADCVEYLIQCDRTLVDKPNSQGLTPLIKAVFKSEHAFRGQFKKTIILLLQAGANPNICPVSKISPLHLAASKADENLIQLLLSYGANVNAICSQGTSPLLKALLLRHQKSTCVKTLLDAGADVNISTVAGRSALHLAVAKCENECVQNILEVGADPNAQDKYGKTPLWIAVHENNIEIVPLLIQNGGDVNYHLPVGNISLLSLAITENLLDMTELLLKLGASVLTESSMGATPLYYAVQNQNLKIIKLLLSENCELNVVSNAHHSLNPQTPMQVAIELANLDIIKLLLEAGCTMKRNWIKSMIPALQNLNPTTGQEIIAFLREYTEQVQTLKFLCRNEMRRIMKQNIKTKIDYLISEFYIPGRLGEYVLLSYLK